MKSILSQQILFLVYAWLNVHAIISAYECSYFYTCSMGTSCSLISSNSAMTDLSMSTWYSRTWNASYNCATSACTSPSFCKSSCKSGKHTCRYLQGVVRGKSDLEIYCRQYITLEEISTRDSSRSSTRRNYAESYCKNIKPMENSSLCDNSLSCTFLATAARQCTHYRLLIIWNPPLKATLSCYWKLFWRHLKNQSRPLFWQGLYLVLRFPDAYQLTAEDLICIGGLT